MPKCPRAAKGNHGAHDLCAVLPANEEQPMVLFCSRCGHLERHELTLMRPVDDWPDDAIAQLARMARRG